MNGRDLSAGFLQTDEMRAADAAIAASTPETDPENWTKTTNYGWIYTGPLAQKNTATQKANYVNRNLGGPTHDQRRQWKTGSRGWMMGGEFLEQDLDNGVGWGKFSQDSWDRRKGAGFRNFHPLIDTNPHDHAAILELYKQSHYNPYASDHYADGDKQVKEGSVADVLYGLTKDRNYNKRMAAFKAINQQRGDMAQTKMTQRFWNDTGLNDIFGEYNDYVDNPYATNPLINRDRSGDTTGNRYLTGGGDRGTMGEIPTTTTGDRRGFLGAYRAKREEQAAARPSVRSLFREMEDYENE